MLILQMCCFTFSSLSCILKNSQTLPAQHTQNSGNKQLINTFIHPLIIYQGHRGTGAYPSCDWTRDGAHPVQVISLLQGYHTETDNHSRPHVANLESQINRTRPWYVEGSQGTPKEAMQT